MENCHRRVEIYEEWIQAKIKTNQEVKAGLENVETTVTSMKCELEENYNSDRSALASVKQWTEGLHKDLTRDGRNSYKCFSRY
jgi:hypothetical protein